MDVSLAFDCCTVNMMYLSLLLQLIVDWEFPLVFAVSSVCWETLVLKVSVSLVALKYKSRFKGIYLPELVLVAINIAPVKLFTELTYTLIVTLLPVACFWILHLILTISPSVNVPAGISWEATWLIFVFPVITEVVVSWYER